MKAFGLWKGMSLSVDGSLLHNLLYERNCSSKGLVSQAVWELVKNGNGEKEPMSFW